MMKFMERLDQHMGAKTWVANPAARSASNTPAGSSQYPREMLPRHPSAANLHQLRRQPSIDEQRKLKEQRLAELARQLELTQLQNNPPRAKPLSQTPSRPLSPIPNLPAEPLYPPRNDFDLEWQERQRKVEEINDRIEFLKSSGFPKDRTPSPVQLPSRSMSQARMDQVHPNSALPHDYRTPAASSPTIGHGLRHQSSIRSLNSLPASHPIKYSPSMSFLKNHTQKSPSSSQVGYYQALKEAENLIGKLRKSHDDLLERAKDLENQLKLKEDQNRDLKTRNQRLEAFLADEQSVKEDIRMENERLMNQLKSRSFPLPTSSINPRTQANNSHQQNTFDSLPKESGSFHHISSARLELLKREANLQRHYASEYSIPPIRPEPIQPGSNLQTQTSPQPAPKSNVASSNNHDHIGAHASGHTSAFRFPTNRDTDPTNEESRLTNDSNPNHINGSSSIHQRNLGSNGLDDLLGPSHYPQDPPLIHGQFTSQSHHLRPSPPFMNDQLPWNYHNPPAGLRPQPFPAHGFY